MASFIGTLRTEVAVGMASEASMLRAVRIGAPLSCVRVGSDAASLRTTKLGRLADRPIPDPGDSGARSWRADALDSTVAGRSAAAGCAGGTDSAAAAAGLAAGVRLGGASATRV